MTLHFDGITIETSKEVEQLPKELIDFAIKHLSTNGDYYWNYKWKQFKGSKYRLSNIHIINRMWDWSKKIRSYYQE